MILYKNVCDHCGKETQIEETADSFQIDFRIENLYEQIHGRRYSRDYLKKTFCRKGCLAEWFKENLDCSNRVKEEDDAPF